MPNSHYEKYGKKWYENNKEKQIAANRIQQAKWRRQWNEYKATLSCAKCGFAHPAAMDFHHITPRDPANKKVNQLVKQRLYAQAYKEIERCIVLCANCHRIHHWEEDQSKKDPHPLDV